MLEEWLLSLIYPWFNPIFWFIVILTWITYTMVKKIWLVGLISFAISILLFGFLLSSQTGILDLGMSFTLKIAFFSSVYSVIMVWLGKVIGQKLKASKGNS